MSIKKASESEYTKFDVIPTGITEIDLITGIGGIPTRKATEIFGVWSIGKSTVAMYIVASAQAMGKPVLWADVERSWTNDYAQTLGVDTDKVDLLIAKTGEDILNEMEEWAFEHKDGLIVVDSVGALSPRQELEKNAGEKTTAPQAGLMSPFTRRMIVPMTDNNHALVLLNHGYNPMNFGAPAAYQNIQPSGGTKLEYFKNLSIFLKKTYVKQDDKLKKIERADGTEAGSFVKAIVYKNKVASTKGREAVFALTYGFGVKKDWNLLELALESGVITKEGNTYRFEDEKLAVGLKATRLFIEENPDIAEKIKEKLNAG